MASYCVHRNKSKMAPYGVDFRWYLREVAAIFECPDETTAAMVACLRNVPARDFIHQRMEVGLLCKTLEHVVKQNEYHFYRAKLFLATVSSSHQMLHVHVHVYPWQAMYFCTSKNWTLAGNSLFDKIIIFLKRSSALVANTRFFQSVLALDFF